MKKNGKRVLSILLAGSMLLGEAAVSMSAAPVYAAGKQKTAKQAKYISDVFIAYGKTESDAVKWLKDNGWEPIKGDRDFNAGKKSSDGKSVAAVMGIRRTDKAKDAITDMAVMNMSGNYDFPGYEEILDAKRAEIDDFIYSFLPTIEEFRANFNGEGSEMGQQRAELAYELLNKFYDGGSEEKYCQNDTELPLGDLLLAPTVQEGAGEGSGDLEQIILEGSGPAVTAVENALALAADTAEDSWMERLEYLTMDELTENLESYVPEAEGQDLAPSAAVNLLMQEYGDAADTLADQWADVHEEISWYEAYRDSHDLDMHEDENEEEYKARYDAAFEELQTSEIEDQRDLKKYAMTSFLVTGLETAPYHGEWGETLYDFFASEGDSVYAGATESYLPMAAALSEGQRCGLSFLPLELLLRLGVSNGECDEDLFADTEELLDGCDSISVYSGVNRGIFRDGIALTTKALMEDIRGEQSAVSYDENGVYKALSIGAIVTGCIFTVVGGAILGHGLNRLYKYKAPEFGSKIVGPKSAEKIASKIKVYSENKDYLLDKIEALKTKKADLSNNLVNVEEELSDKLKVELFGDVWHKRIDINKYNTKQQLEYVISESTERLKGIERDLPKYKKEYEDSVKGPMRKEMAVGAVIAAIGIILLTVGIVSKINETHDTYVAYHNKEFTKIPTMIVDVDDIVTYVEEDGEMKRHIELDQYAYYEAVRCNRQDVGELGKWQKGVSDYEKQGCGDIADLNADQGLEWLTLYTAKAAVKGARPILADSLKLAYGEKNKPDVDTPSLHFFCSTGRVDLADRAYCYSNNKGKMFFTWNVEKAA